jgi:outer membrane protein assembly factor BamB
VSAPVSPLKHSSEAAALGAQVAKAVAWVSGLFSLVACVTLIMSQVQIMAVDPFKDPTLKELRAQVAKDQKNQQLRESVRGFYFMQQRAFFANQMQQRATGLLLLFGVAVFLASMKTYVELKLKLPVPEGQAPREGGSSERAAGRWAVTAGAGLVVVGTLLMVFLSPPPIDLDAKPEDATPAAGATGKTEGAAPAKSEAGTAGKGAETSAAAPGKFEAPPLHAWPMFRGPYGLGVAGHAEAPLEWDGKSRKNVKWAVPVPKPGNSSPIVWDKLVFLTGGDEQGRSVYAFETETGKLAWEGKIGSAGDGGLKKLDASVGYCAPTMATDGERVFAIVATGEINAFTMDGKPAWPGNLGAPNISYGYGSSLAVVPGRVLIQMDTEKGGRLVLLDAKTGKKVLDRPRAGVKMSWASPALAMINGKPQALLVGDPFLMGHDAVTAEALWRANWIGEASGEVAPSAAFANGIAYVVTDRVGLFAIKPGEEKPLWKYEDDLPDTSSPVATEKVVVMAHTSSGMVTCVDAAKGTKLWTHEYEDGFVASPVAVGDRVYLTDKKGVTHVLRLGDKFEELAKNELGQETVCTPAIPKGRVYIRTKSSLFCIGKD